MAVGDFITATDYNTIRSKVSSVLGNGSISYGYGQTVQSSTVAVGNTVTKTQWDALRWDLYNALFHQTGTVPSITQVAVGDVIQFGAGFPNNQYNTLADTAVTNRFNLGTGQYVTEVKGSVSKTDSWYSNVSSTVTVTFPTQYHANHFFNSGGKVRFTSTRTGGSAVAQNSSWSNILASAGTQAFSATTTLNLYNLTSSDQTFYTLSGSSPYSSNTYRIQARCNVANNSGGTANVITFTVSWIDNYVDSGPATPENPAPGDLVDGTLTLDVDQIRATGTLQPAPATGSFTISGPSGYTISAISGT